MLILEGWTKPIIRMDRQTGGELEEVYEPKMKLLKLDLFIHLHLYPSVTQIFKN